MTKDKGDHVWIMATGIRNSKADPQLEWTRQKSGVTLEASMSVSEVKKVMEEVTVSRPYHVTKFNCHMAQENTRRRLGLKVR